MNKEEGIKTDIMEEAERVWRAADNFGILLRLIGGLAVRVHSESSLLPALARNYKDLDFATQAGNVPRLTNLLKELGYVPDKAFNALNMGRRQLFYETESNRQLDLFVDTFEMCHTIPLHDRLKVEKMTIPLAELFLSKIQIIQLNEKDVKDLFALLLDHKIAAGDKEVINRDIIAERTAKDWGFFHTIELNLAKLRLLINNYELGEKDGEKILLAIEAILEVMNRSKKGLNWQMRSKIGEKLMWYKLPEEVG
ncbi:Hypothetical protein DEACI_1274 [Acididesulfobacillus acetoxydans]|uniref:Nucleotidyltransferase family protein n=1 Tax=Acididesulfobacillus acetoxydans TaxID=1561005 RepID=A0A8S0WWZ5_9FIRM|nr:hypothetical protein [Acididesulfobacillus acetoxydans]CAA7600621.1 Hypothetical protein DEACI_1274 [Acididesulfobacillus acetoxydans]CEJ09402.1 Hypothetical protein DEACI_3886 [Acididesulfobacillus acetoxydans]